MRSVKRKGTGNATNMKLDRLMNGAGLLARMKASTTSSMMPREVFVGSAHVAVAKLLSLS
jgi:hypothetical protein